ncbi:helix-turn-helix domain-containing protein [Streptomyces sp. NPDC057301]|uniref:helix-turn-helix domain-containing protein n=1 Tax=Streptomyces sp. NPDC057301 TaxID=3346093 RepID=UPI003642079C
MASHHSARPHDHARALAQRVRALREVREWSRERLAKEAGIAVGTLARLESEGAIQPGFFTGGAAAEALEGSLDELFRETMVTPGLWSAGHEGRDIDSFVASLLDSRIDGRSPARGGAPLPGVPRLAATSKRTSHSTVLHPRTAPMSVTCRLWPTSRTARRSHYGAQAQYSGPSQRRSVPRRLAALTGDVRLVQSVDQLGASLVELAVLVGVRGVAVVPVKLGAAQVAEFEGDRGEFGAPVECRSERLPGVIEASGLPCRLPSP